MQFDALGFPRCKGVWAADSVSSDYETWTPSDGVNAEKCMLGQQVTYTRRKRTAQCWNGENFERAVTKKNCACTQEDFACEMGFTRSVGSTECKYGGPELLPERFIPAVCSGTFGADAYRKVPGDVCEGGFTPVKVQVPCPPQINSGHLKTGFIGLMALGALYMAYTRFCGASKSNSNPLGDFSAPSKMQCSSPTALLAACCAWIGGKLQGGRGFDHFPSLQYAKLSGNEFDLDGMASNEESLTEFLDEADQDDFAPRVYGDSSLDGKRGHQPTREERQIIPGAARDATDAVPKLQAPPGQSAAAPSRFNISRGDEDLL